MPHTVKTSVGQLWVPISLIDKVFCFVATAGPFIKPNKQMLEASSKKKKIPYKKGTTFKIKIK
jgi:hypothetical protein